MRAVTTTLDDQIALQDEGSLFRRPFIREIIYKNAEELKKKSRVFPFCRMCRQRAGSQAVGDTLKTLAARRVAQSSVEQDPL